ncbi:MAG: undecaprenyl/decaprenyl-phosphate alpha-N-acetylglucosaminyl 1-phosphate transferase [Planctomycetes bacterium]|nr:undecaprenyl/decaprenyl-phosphate alpha-N-acetylglucosaminyl 1-phosphate transferase [Planctomycetota bacterium]MBU1518348.1 undecaprenyl/decaprenyl-phosphate alpha-N-acetylglucosaminyl 1-phosphate transferase [Planctomycetota bacterium]MBU2458559.1 undecaprenyl/decaprenyl-phosphate alpha-N-acetylglucosaminyl 1-phosphate transferase [Planctomycetota bacterium]
MLASIVGPYKEISWIIPFWPVLVFSFIAALPGTWLCKKIALKFGAVDKPDGTVKTHKQPIAYLGGLGILLGFASGIVAGITLLEQTELFGLYLKLLVGILAGASVACFVGLVDDLFDIRPSRKILGQALAAVILLTVGIRPNLSIIFTQFGIELPATLEAILGIPVVIIFVLGATNSLNLIDGLDGLCAGVTSIITIGMLILAVHLGTWNLSSAGDPVRAIVGLGLVGATLGFLPFNKAPAKIFMGDAGSMLLGFVVAAMMILFAERQPLWWMASLMIFGLPILDTAVALVRRLLNKRPLFVSDRGHIYDQMMDRGIPLKKTVGICYILAGVYAAIGLIMCPLRHRYAAIILAVTVIISAVVIWKKGFLKMEGLRGAVKKTGLKKTANSGSSHN